MLSYNHKNFCYLSEFHPQDVASVNERYSGFKKALSDHGIFESKFIKIDNFNIDTPIDFPMLKHIVNSLYQDNVTAIVCENDKVAFNVYLACRSLSLTLPNDINVTGFDNNHWATMGSSSITTVDQDFSLLGEKIAEILLQKNYSPKHIVIPIKLVPRNTTGHINFDKNVTTDR